MSTRQVTQTALTSSSSRAPVTLHLRSEDPALVQFTQFGASLRGLLDANADLNAQLMQTAERSGEELANRQLSLVQLQQQVEEGSVPVEFSEEQHLETEIAEIGSRMEGLALKIEKHLKKKTLQLKKQIESEKEKQEKVRLGAEKEPGLEALERQMAEWNGKLAGAAKTEKAAKEKLDATLKIKAEVIEAYRKLADQIAALAEQEAIKVQPCIPGVPPDFKTPAHQRQHSINNNLTQLHSGLRQIVGYFGGMKNDHFS